MSVTRIIDLFKNISAGATAEQVFLRLREDHQRDKIPFTYGVSRKVAKPIWAGNLPLEAAKNAALKRYPKKGSGQTCNVEVIKNLHRLADGKSRQTGNVPRVNYPYGRDKMLPLSLDFYFIEAGKVYLVLIQPRKMECPNIFSLAILAKIIKSAYVPDIFDDAELCLIDMSADCVGGERRISMYGFSDLPNVSDKEIARVLEVYDAGYALYSAWAEQNPKKVNKSKDTGDQQGMLDFS
jgi:hypothetical protein